MQELFGILWVDLRLVLFTYGSIPAKLLNPIITTFCDFLCASYSFSNTPAGEETPLLQQLNTTTTTLVVATDHLIGSHRPPLGSFNPPPGHLRNTLKLCPIFSVQVRKSSAYVGFLAYPVSLFVRFLLFHVHITYLDHNPPLWVLSKLI